MTSAGIYSGIRLILLTEISIVFHRDNPFATLLVLWRPGGSVGRRGRKEEPPFNFPHGMGEK
jgi:hypothetical protein